MEGVFFPAAEFRFLEKASQFADQFWMFMQESLAGNPNSVHTVEELSNIWQIYLMKIGFDLP